jgi:hypothetical protein
MQISRRQTVIHAANSRPASDAVQLSARPDVWVGIVDPNGGLDNGHQRVLSGYSLPIGAHSLSHRYTARNASGI